MKSATFLAAALLSACATAAPFFKKREYVYNVVTQEVIETVVITTTVWVDPPSATAEAVEPVAQEAEPTGGAFYEIPSSAPAPSSAAPQAQAPAAVPSVAAQEVSAAAPEVTQAPVAAPVESAAPVVEAPAPVASSAAPAAPVAPVVEAPVSSAAAPAYTPPAAAADPEPVASTPAASTSSGSGQFSGDMTYFTPGVGACGFTNGESDWIVAIAESQFDEKANPANPGNPNMNGWCAQKISINYMGKSYSATVTDRCTACTKGDLDMPVAMFDTITQGTGNGRVPEGMTWSLA